MSLFVQLGKNTMTLLFGSMGSAALSFVLSVIIGRALGEEGLGVYAAALAWVYPVSLLVEFGFGTLLTRDVAQRPQMTHAYVRAAAVARLLLGGSAAVALVLLAPLLSDSPAVVVGLRISAPLVVVLPLYGTFTAVFRAYHRMGPVAWLNIGMIASQVALTAGWLQAGGDSQGVFLINTVTSTGQLIAAWGVYRLRFYQPGTVKLALRPLLRDAYPFAIASVLAALHARVSLILLETLTTTAAVGHFAAVMRFVDAGHLLARAFFDALFPTLSTLALDPARLERTFRRIALLLAGAGILAGIVLGAAAPLLIEWTYGPDFTAAVPVLQVAGWSLLPLLLKGARILYWFARGAEAFVNRMTAVALAVRLLLTLLLVPSWGAVGAAWAAVAAETVNLALLYLPRGR